MPCIPTVPFDLPTTPLTDEEAIAWVGGDLTAMVGQDFVGGCSCDAEPYVRPECPPCTCDDACSQKHVVISGPGEPADGTYTIITEVDCAEGCCCWRGFEEDTQIAFDLQWCDGTWSGTFDGGPTYTGTGEVCDNPVILNRVGGAAGWPATITILDDCE